MEDARTTRTEIEAVTFKTRMQKAQPHFSISRKALDALGYERYEDWAGKEFEVQIESLDTGVRYPKRVERVIAGTPSVREMRWHGPSLKPLERVRVIISEPD